MAVFGSLKRGLRRTLSSRSASQLSLEDEFIYRIRIIGHSSLLVRFCIEDILFEVADEMGIGISFVEEDPCNLCVLCDDIFLGSKARYCSEMLETIKAPVFAFGIGSEGVGGIKTRNRRKLRQMLQRMESISVRSKIVAQYVSQLSGREDSVVTGDPMLSFSPIDIQQDNSVRKIGIAPINWNMRYSNADELYGSIAAYCNRCLECPSTEVHFFCFSRGKENDDEIIAQRIKTMLSNTDRVIIHPYLSDILLSYSRIGQIDYLVSMRSTAAVSALLCKKPFVVMEMRNSRGDEIFNLLGCGDSVISQRDIAKGSVDRKIEDMEKVLTVRTNDLFSSAMMWRQIQRKFASVILSYLVRLKRFE